MTDSQPMVSTGSLLNTSEGLLSTGVLAALTTSLTTSEDWRVQAASAIGLSILGAAYVVSRTMLKKTATEVED